MANELSSSPHLFSQGFLSLLAAHKPHSSVKSTDWMTPNELTEHLMKDTVAYCPTVRTDSVTFPNSLEEELHDHIKAEPPAVKQEFPDHGEIVIGEDVKELKEIVATRTVNANNNNYQICEPCDFKTKYKNSFKEHLKTLKHTRMNQLPLTCTLCEFKAQDLSSYDYHYMTTHGRRFACSFCDYRAKHANHLKSHELTHSKVKKFGCVKCTYRTNHKGRLKSHQQTVHSSKKPFTCSKCDFQSARKDNLRRHMLKFHEVQ